MIFIFLKYLMHVEQILCVISKNLGQDNIFKNWFIVSNTNQ